MYLYNYLLCSFNYIVGRQKVRTIFTVLTLSVPA